MIGRFFVKEIDLDHLGESDKEPKSEILGLGVIRKSSQTQPKVSFRQETGPCTQGPNLRQVGAELDHETPSHGQMSDPKLFGLGHRKTMPFHLQADTLSGSKTCGPVTGSKNLGPLSRGKTELHPRIGRLNSGYSVKNINKELNDKYTSKLRDFDLLSKVPIEEIDVDRKDMKKVSSLVNLASLNGSRETDRRANQ